MDIIEKSIKKYSNEMNNLFQDLATVEGRGWEPIECLLLGGFSCTALKSFTLFEGIDLSDDWCEYDEKGKSEVSVLTATISINKI